jgi:hypothetical protein
MNSMEKMNNNKIHLKRKMYLLRKSRPRRQECRGKVSKT